MKGIQKNGLGMSLVLALIALLSISLATAVVQDTSNARYPSVIHKDVSQRVIGDSAQNASWTQKQVVEKTIWDNERKKQRQIVKPVTFYGVGSPKNITTGNGVLNTWKKNLYGTGKESFSAKLQSLQKNLSDDRLAARKGLGKFGQYYH